MVHTDSNEDSTATAAVGLSVSSRAVARIRAAQAGEFPLLGKVWDMFSGVFPPEITHGTEFYTRHLPFPRGGRYDLIFWNLPYVGVPVSREELSEAFRTVLDVGDRDRGHR